MPLKTIIKDLINYIIRNYTNNINSQFLDFSEFIVHLQDTDFDDLLGYSLPKLYFHLSNICN